MVITAVHTSEFSLLRSCSGSVLGSPKRGPLLGSLRDRRLRCSQARDGHAERRAAHIVQPYRLEKLNRRGIPAVLAANPELDSGSGRTALADGDVHQLPDTSPIDGGERIIRHDFPFGVIRQE